MNLHLSTRDRAILNGHEGEAKRFAMDMVVQAATIMDAPYLIDVSFLHIDACHYYGRVHLDFARYLLKHEARFHIPAWTNTLLVNLEGPDIRPGADPVLKQEAQALPRLYEAMGARPVWTCAPYQLPGGPNEGDQIIGSESNAVAYYNSVVGARTNKYGDFLEVCAGLVARAPYAGLHTDAGRRGTMLVDIARFPDALKSENLFYHLLGHITGKTTGEMTGTGSPVVPVIPVISGLPAETTPDQLKALSAAVAASGGVELFHAIGVTPEAPDQIAAFHGNTPDHHVSVSQAMMLQALEELSTVTSGRVTMVAVGTPHFSFSEFEALVSLIAGRSVHEDVTFYVTTSRFVRDLVAGEGWLELLEQWGVTVVVDTCTYFMPGVRNCKGRVMTNSAKWAYYAPGMLDMDGVALGSLRECVETATGGVLWRDPVLWGLLS